MLCRYLCLSRWFSFTSQLLFSSSPYSFIPAISGLIAGALYSLAPIKKWRLPRLIQKFAKAYLYPLIATEQTAVVRTNHTQPSNPNTPVVEAPRPSPIAATPLSAVASEDDIQLLVAMGFDRAAGIRALQDSGNDVQLAATRLLDGRYQ